MGCFSSRKTFIEEKIEECESYLKIATKNISKIKEAFFQLNDGDIIKENALRRALINLDLDYSSNIVSYVVYPFFQSFSIDIAKKEENNENENENGKKDDKFILKLEELMKKNVHSGLFDFNQIICVLYLLSNEKGSTKASELFKYFAGPGQNKMDKHQMQDFFSFLFQAVVCYSLIFSELSPKKIVSLNSKLQENVFLLKNIYLYPVNENFYFRLQEKSKL